MRKTNKNLTKQILTLMLAFVMVFTGMGFGSWGVDQAWADEDNFSKIARINYEATAGTVRNFFVVNHENNTAVCEAKSTKLVTSNYAKRLKLVDAEENNIAFDNMSGDVNKWTWTNTDPTTLELTITIGEQTKTYTLSCIYKPDPTYFKTLLYNYGQWTRFSYQEGVDEYKDTAGTGLTVTENVAKASELKLEGCTGKILAIESDYC